MGGVELLWKLSARGQLALPGVKKSDWPVLNVTKASKCLFLAASRWVCKICPVYMKYYIRHVILVPYNRSDHTFLTVSEELPLS